MRGFYWNGDALTLMIPPDQQVTRPSSLSISLDPMPIVQNLKYSHGVEAMTPKLFLVVVVQEECLHHGD